MSPYSLLRAVVAKDATVVDACSYRMSTPSELTGYPRSGCAGAASRHCNVRPWLLTTPDDCILIDGHPVTISKVANKPEVRKGLWML